MRVWESESDHIYILCLIPANLSKNNRIYSTNALGCLVQHIYFWCLFSAFSNVIVGFKWNNATQKELRHHSYNAE